MTCPKHDLSCLVYHKDGVCNCYSNKQCTCEENILGISKEALEEIVHKSNEEQKQKFAINKLILDLTSIQNQNNFLTKSETRNRIEALLAESRRRTLAEVREMLMAEWKKDRNAHSVELLNNVLSKLDEMK